MRRFTRLFVIAIALELAWNVPATLQAKEISSISPAQLEDMIANNKGNVLIVDFFATWCPPCRQEIPGFVDLQKKYGAKGLAIVGVSVDEGPVSVVENFAQELGINYTLYQGTGDMSRKYRIRAIPTTYVFDKAGKKVKTHIGYVSEEEFEKQITALL